MFCGNCGNQIPDNVKFCPICGQLTDGGEAESQGVSQQPYVEQPYAGMVYGENINPPQEASKKKKGNIGLIVGCVAAVVVLIAVVVVGAILVVKKGNEDTSEARRSSRTEKEAESSSEEKDVSAILSESAQGSDDKEDNDDESVGEDVDFLLDAKYEYIDSGVWVEQTFSDGYAWIEVNDSWYCIDETGKEVFKLDESYGYPSKWYNEYSLVGSKYVVNLSGDIVYTIDRDEYDVYDYEALDEGCIILSKEIDEYERSGTFYYVLNLETSNIEEIDLSMSNYYTEDSYTYEGNGIGVSDYVAKLGEYVGCGKYTIVLRAHHYSTTEEFGPWVYSTVQIYDAITNSIQECVVEDEYYKGEICFYTTKEKNIKYLTIDTGFEMYVLKYDIEKNTIEYVDTGDKMVESVRNFWNGNSNATELIGDNILKVICENDESTYLKYIDLYSDNIYELDTKYEDSDAYNMEYEVIGYKDGIFILSMKNDAGSLYFAIVDGEGNTILDATYYDYSSTFLPCFAGKNIVYYDGEGFCFVDSQNGSQLNKLTMESIEIGSGGPDSLCVSSGEDGFFAHTENNGSLWTIYDNTGSNILGSGGIGAHEDDQAYYEIAIWDAADNGKSEFWDINGNKLTIALYD